MTEEKSCLKALSIQKDCISLQSSQIYGYGLLSYSTFKVFSGPPLQNIGAKSAPFDIIEPETITIMLHFKGKATFKCKQCGHKFEAFDTEGGIRFGPNLPPCPKCGSSDTRKATIIDKLLVSIRRNTRCISCSLVVPLQSQ